MISVWCYNSLSSHNVTFKDKSNHINENMDMFNKTAKNMI